MYKKVKDGYEISTDKSKLNLVFIHQYLSVESYWAKNIPVEIVQKSIEGSICFGIYKEGQQVGFARVITDGATFGYLADIFITETHRGKGLSKWLMETILNHPSLQNFRRWMLATRDAHGLYRQFGFAALEKPERFMQYQSVVSYPPPDEKEMSK